MLLKLFIFLSISSLLAVQAASVDKRKKPAIKDVDETETLFELNPRRRNVERDLYENYDWSEEDEEVQIDWINTPHPSQVSIRSANVHQCTGTIISNQWIVTSASCFVDDLPVATLSVVAGSSSLTDFDQVFKVKKVVIHPRFMPRNLDYDIALLNTESMVMMGGLREPARIINGGRQAPLDVGAEVVGWTRQNAKIMSDRAEVAEFTTMPDSVCRSAWWNNTSPRMLCAMGDLSNLEGCQPDKGSPIVSIGRNPTLFGIFSWGPSNCGVSMPYIFTNLSNVEIRGFIRRHTQL